MADFKYNYKVCTCNDVTLGEIIHAIKENNASCLESIGKLTDAGTTCGCCKSKEDDFRNPKMKLYLDQIIDKFVN